MRRPCWAAYLFEIDALDLRTLTACPSSSEPRGCSWSTCGPAAPIPLPLWIGEAHYGEILTPTRTSHGHHPPKKRSLRETRHSSNRQSVLIRNQTSQLVRSSPAQTGQSTCDRPPKDAVRGGRGWARPSRLRLDIGREEVEGAGMRPPAVRLPGLRLDIGRGGRDGVRSLPHWLAFTAEPSSRWRSASGLTLSPRLGSTEHRPPVWT